jgi:hypothetical protein
MRFALHQFSTVRHETDAARATSRFLTSPTGATAAASLVLVGSCFARMNTEIKHETRYVTKFSCSNIASIYYKL